jgi:hypothetical protein
MGDIVHNAGIRNYVQRGVKYTIDTIFNTIVGSVDNFSFSPQLQRRGSKIDAVRKVFKYESLVYHGWRSIWCTYITIVAYYNFVRLEAELKEKYTDNGEAIPYHSLYDRKTSSDISMLILFFSIDLLIYMLRKKFMSRSVIGHHLVGITLCIIAFLSKFPHHYHANLFMCTEIVSCMTVVAHYARKSRSKTLYKLYLIQYLILTIFGRGWIWYRVLSNLIENDVSTFCYIGFLPLTIMDVIWSKQCIDGLRK